MNSFSYTPDDEIKISPNTIHILCKGFSSHEKGIPEWVKNSLDAYIREDATTARSVIILFFDKGGKNRLPSISVLDFVGMTAEDIDTHFRHWGDPDAAGRGRHGKTVTGGHGNGGKCYMIQMFKSYAYIITLRNGRISKYGVQVGTARLGYAPDRDTGRAIPCEDAPEALKDSLLDLGFHANDLPESAKKCFETNRAFTLVRGVSPKGLDGRSYTFQKLLDSLKSDPQTIKVLQQSKVYAFINGKVANNGKPIGLPEIPPMTGWEKPIIFEIPSKLLDPESGVSVSTTNDGKTHRGKLEIRTSEKNLKYQRKGRANILYECGKGVIGYVETQSLTQSGYATYLYGRCLLESLENYTTNTRINLAESQLTRAVHNWLCEQVTLICAEIEKKKRREQSREEKDSISKMNEALDRWKNRFLRDTLSYIIGGTGEGQSRRPSIHLPVGKVERILLELTHAYAGLDVPFRPSIKFFDAQGRRVRAVPFEWISDDTNVFRIQEDLDIVETYSYGKTYISARTSDGHIVSNKVGLEVVRIHGIQMEPKYLQMYTGGRVKITASCDLGREKGYTSDIYLMWTVDDESILQVSASGMAFARSVGKTNVVAHDDKCMAADPTVVEIVDGVGRSPGDRKGRGYPKVLVSGIDNDPDTGQPVTFTSEYPPVTQMPGDVERNIWWINSASPLAVLYTDKQKGYGCDSIAWRVYFIERYVEILVQIVLQHLQKEGELDPENWFIKWGEITAQIQEEAAASLHDFIESGALPEE